MTALMGVAETVIALEEGSKKYIGSYMKEDQIFNHSP